MTLQSEIPIIDVGAIHSGDPVAMANLAVEFAAAYSTSGFSYIINHGVSQSLVDRVFDASARFHALPRADKMAIELNHLHRGFIPINTSTDVNSKLADVTRPNQSESFMMMREDGPSSPDVLAGGYLAGPNQWPDLEGFRRDVTAYHDALATLGRSLVGVVAKSIGADPEALLPHFERPTTWLRLLFYPPTDPVEGDDLFGSAPHCDFGFLTILAQDQIGGLQVQTPGGTWADAPPIPGAFVVNVGDMLHRWSNGFLLSTPHRVINRSGKERYSCPFFFDPNVATEIAPLASCISPEGPAKFGSLMFGDFLRGELEAGYEKHKRP
ncbi:MAG: isopenicillin N synthase family oxygenase [Rhodospirillaceae bacterium]|jgi:isopenicillin N synthase-like dioxygenase|nr:isopenicillin N synthase family oxygenase [Rhodospirillaceae bacterium]